jgi:DNA (cytosine-5)-methyltransferase 1
MKKYKILNLYSCLGGNRKHWDNCEVTSVEINPDLCELYSRLYPNDRVICADAHRFLLSNFQDYDFIWSSPPCTSHSRARYAVKSLVPLYPDMTLYQEIILLNKHCQGFFVVENVIPYYEPLIQGCKIGRHIFWSNLNLNFLAYKKPFINIGTSVNEYSSLCKHHGINPALISKFKNRLSIIRNLVDADLGNAIFERFLQIKESRNVYKNDLFDI